MQLNNSRRGFTLMEVLVSAALIAVAAVMTMQLVTMLARSASDNRRANTSLLLQDRLIAELEAAPFTAAGRDPGLAPRALPYTAAQPGSLVITVGRFDVFSGLPDPGGAIQVSYAVEDCAAATCGGATGVEVAITVSGTQGPGLRRQDAVTVVNRVAFAGGPR